MLSRVCVDGRPKARRSGEIGRHARFRGVCRKTCRFESGLRHQACIHGVQAFFCPLVCVDGPVFQLFPTGDLGPATGNGPGPGLGQGRSGSGRGLRYPGF